MTKIDIISGFLGAGKTTLIKRLLADALKGEQVVLIENEFGEIGIDGGFLKDAGIVVNEMNAGCICCSLVGDFGKALHDVVDQYHPDRILIEPSGVGKLSDVISAVQNAHLDVQLNSFVTVVDALKAKMYLKNFGEFFENQVAHAGAILLSRTAECPEKRLDETVAMLRGLNEHARIVTTPWKDLTGEQLLAGQVLPRGGDDAGVLVQAAQHGNGLVQTLLRALCGAGQQDSAGVSDLIFEELAEVLEVHLCLERVNNGDEAVELNVQMGVLNRRDNVGQLADAGRLDEDAVGVVLVYNVVQRLAEVADERAADAARVHFVDNDACVLEKATVDADFTEFVLDEDDLLALERVREQTLDKRGLACAEKTGDNINFCHDLSLHS